MCKKILSCFMVFVICLSLFGCGLERLFTEPDVDGEVIEQVVDGDTIYILYGGNKYLINEAVIISYDYAGGEKVVLSNSHLNTYTSYTDDTPNYIEWIGAKADAVYVREGYDVLSDSFTVRGTEIKFSLSDGTTDDRMEYETGSDAYYSKTTLELVSDTWAAVKAFATVFRCDGKWYIHINNTDGIAYGIDAELVKSLIWNSKIDV